MLLLAIDVGNTNTVFAVYSEEKFLIEWRCATQVSRTADEYYVWLSSLIEFQSQKILISRVVISSVVPQVIFNLNELGNKYFDFAPIVVGKANCKLPVNIRVDVGANVGADRIVNTVAAFDRYGGNLIVVDFGTATTFDVVDSDGAYIGGVISPGVNLSLKALHEAAAALPNIDVSKPNITIGTNTIACMKSGIFWGYIGLVKEICNQIIIEHGSPMTIIGTGGLAPLFSQGNKIFDVVDGELTTHGLFVINKFN